MSRRQKATAEIFQTARRSQPAIDNHVVRQVIILAAKTIRQPRAHARSPRDTEPSVQKVIGTGVFRELTRQAADDGQSIGMPGQMRKERTDPQTTIAMSRKLPRGLERGTVIVELRRLRFHRKRLAMIFRQHRLGIERIHLGWTAIHVQEDHMLGARRVMQCT